MPSDQELLAQAHAAERDLNSEGAKTGNRSGVSDSVSESGIDQSVESKFAAQGATATYGSAASGQGDNREIPESEGGSIANTGAPTKARDFEGEGGPEAKQERARQDRGGDDNVDSIVRSGHESTDMNRHS